MRCLPLGSASGSHERGMPAIGESHTEGHAEALRAMECTSAEKAMKSYWAFCQVFTWGEIIEALRMIDPGYQVDLQGSVGFMPIFDDRAQALAYAGGREELLLEMKAGTQQGIGIQT